MLLIALCLASLPPSSHHIEFDAAAISVTHERSVLWDELGEATTIEMPSTFTAGPIREPDEYVLMDVQGDVIATYDTSERVWKLAGEVKSQPPLLHYVSWTGFFILFIVVVRTMWTTPMMSSSPTIQPPHQPDGLLDSIMTTVFGRSWRTGLYGFLGIGATVAAALSTIEGPLTWPKVAPLLPGLIASTGLLVAKDGKVSHTQLPKS